MASLNQVQLIGRLGQDPELRYTQSQVAVCNFSLATNEVFNDGKGEKKETTEWHRVNAWGKRAETCSQYLSKGREVFVQGRLQTRKWTDSEGVNRYTTEVVAKDVKFLGSKDGNGANAATEIAPPPISEAELAEVPF